MSAGNMVYSCTSPSSSTLYEDSSDGLMFIFPFLCIVPVSVEMDIPQVDEACPVMAPLTDPSLAE